MFSKISGRSRYASLPRLWMTSPLWMTSCPCQVGSSLAKWIAYPRLGNIKNLQFVIVDLRTSSVGPIMFLFFWFLPNREPHSWGCQQMRNCSTRRGCWHSGPNCGSHQGTSCSCSPHHQCWNGKLWTWGLYRACAGVHQTSVWDRLVHNT